ncbi:MAG: hypothetical protein LBG57_11915 [Treponema sp.]|jgi:hypothetical protein|nr:hypothetical protein [Treponema sp.]
MKKNRLNPLNDYLFLKIMGEKGDEEQLCAFLNAVLRREGKEALRAYQMRELALSDRTSGLNHAREEGLQKGKREIAAKMKKRGISMNIH